MNTGNQTRDNVATGTHPDADITAPCTTHKRVDSREFTINDKVTEHVAAHLMWLGGHQKTSLDSSNRASGGPGISNYAVLAYIDTQWWMATARLVFAAVKQIQESDTPVFADLTSFRKRVTDVMLEQNPYPLIPRDASFTTPAMLDRDMLACKVIGTLSGQMEGQRALDTPLSGYADIAGHSAARQVNDCGVVALAIICNISYRKAEGLLREMGRVNHDGTN